MKCVLDAKLHECRFLNRENQDCTNPECCSMQKKTPEPVKREPRWYEKYYK